MHNYQRFAGVSASCAAMLLALATAAPAHADAGKFSVAVKNEYLNRKGVVMHDGPVVQTDITLNLGSYCYYDFWWSASVDPVNFNDNRGDEIDYTLGCAVPVGPLVLDVGATLYDLHSLLTSRNGDAVRLYGELGVPVKAGAWSFAPFARAEYHIPYDWDVPAERGYHLYGGAKATYSTGVFTLWTRQMVLHDSGTYREDVLGHGQVYLPTAGADILPVSWLALNVAHLSWAVPLSDFHGSRKTAFTYGGGLTFMF